MKYSLGIDIGSTTAKLVLLCDGAPVYEKYERHFSRVREKAVEMLNDLLPQVGDSPVSVVISGSAGLGLAEELSVPYVQEVFATGELVKLLAPDTSCVIELGGEDAKIIFFDGGTDERMNGSCAGGTGAFIDQMASLLDVTVEQLDELSMHYEHVYPIASRCGVFAKTDIQPLLNQGARKEDIARSIYLAVVNQTIAGLAQGRRIGGRVLFLGGPLSFNRGLRDCFREVLGLDETRAVCPPYASCSVAYGAAYYAQRHGKEYDIGTLIRRIEESHAALRADRLPPLFRDRAEYEAFAARHAKATVPTRDITDYSGAAYLGIDCGSTTTKLVLVSDKAELLYTYYAPNLGNPVEIVRAQLQTVFDLCGDRIRIAGSAVTGYGEELIRAAFGVDLGVVETIAHYTAAKHFDPNVSFILDIGGQDIKCFRIRSGAIDSIMLNEACSSGCGSFLETFARSMGYSVADFAARGIDAGAPVNLGSRCTVFMNSSVKQSQKEGASVEDISAGLSVSVIRNALYKVIRIHSADELGENIVVQGGTFYNDAVLRAFEKELSRQVTRPTIAGLMGAYGAALCAMRCRESTLISRAALASFAHTAKSAVCHGCTNHCRLTVNTFEGGRRYISGNRCERGLGLPRASALPNVQDMKREYLASLEPGEATHGTVGMPLALGMYELLPLWHGIFRALGYRVIVSSPSTRRTYERGQFTIPSDTACYPAKIMHGHIAELVEQKPDMIFYPCLTYNVDEHASDNHYNCPVVAYYGELLGRNIDALRETRFFTPYLNINDPRELARELYTYLRDFTPSLSRREVLAAVRAGYDAYDRYMAAVRRAGEEAVSRAGAEGHRIMILAGRPYHIDPEIGHGIDRLANSLGFAVVTEDSVAHLTEAPQNVRVLNQWTYHARLYRAAKYATEHRDTELVQLVSFGCGVDAITTDEVRRILEQGGKYYTQLKIDEITNLGAVKIRLRSLLGALEAREREENA